MTIFEERNSSLITFQSLSSSGLLTVPFALNLSLLTSERQCLYFVYMRGRFQDDHPLIPDEIRFNQSLCLNCQRNCFLQANLLFFFFSL